MHFWLRYPFVRITLAFCLGIALGPLLGELNWIWLSIPASLIFFAIVFRKSKLSGLFILFSIVLLGIVQYVLNNEIRQPSHFSKLTFNQYIAVVDHPPDESTQGQNATILVREVHSDGAWVATTGHIRAYVDKRISYGDVLLLKQTPKPVRAPLNPHEFDFQRYLRTKNVHHQVFIGEDYQLLAKSTPSRLKKWSLQVRKRAELYLEAYVVDQEALGVVKALLLGNRADLSENIRQSYAHVGIVHILAVSGLHLGIIYGFLLLVFRSYASRYWFLVLALCAIWGFTFISGLSPSAVRAAFMFSILSFGRVVGRSGNGINNLFLAGFLQLLISPMVLYEVGFQLSYLAVLGILILFPALNNLFVIRNKVIRWAWDLTCISVAAQIFTAPLVAYYFHNVSLIFLFTNLFAVPFATLLLGMGGLFFLFSVFRVQAIQELIGKGMEVLIQGFNQLVEIVERVPGAYLGGIFIDQWLLILSYLAVLFFVLFFVKKDYSSLQLAVLFWLAVVGYQTYFDFLKSKQHGITFYRTPGNLVIDYYNGRDVFAFSYGASPYQTEGNRQFLIGNRQLNALPTHAVNLPGTLLQVEEKSILVLNESFDGSYEFKDVIHVDLLVISNNAVNEPEIIKIFSPSLVLLDASNDFWYAQRVYEILTTSGINTVNIWDGAHKINVY